MLLKFFFTLVLTQLFIISCISKSSQSGAVITLNPAVTYQTISGWEAAILNTSAEDTDEITAALPQIFDEAINDLGINRVQLGIFAGTENDQDYWTQWWADGTITFQDWKSHRAKPVNDNSDPFTIDWSRFHFSNLDFSIDNFILPLKQRKEALGETLYIRLNYVDFDTSPFEHYQDPEEYAEFILATFQHIESKYGFVPDAVEVKLEPDNNGGWNDGGTKLGNALVAAAKRLEANGYTPEFVAPSTINRNDAINFFDNMIKISGVDQYLTEFTYHRYGTADLTFDLQEILNRALQYNLRTAMTEYWNAKNNYRYLHEDLKTARNSAWQQGILGDEFNGPGAFYHIDKSNPNNLVVSLAPRTKYNRQYYKFVRPGAVRIDATSTDNNFDPLAFVNSDGKSVVVVKAEVGGSFAINGLSAGTYGIKYTTGDGKNQPTQFDVDLPDVFIGSDQSINTSIPEAGVITVYGKPDAATPVELSLFQEQVLGRDVILTWVTQSEANNFGFEVQRSQDGTKFSGITFIQGKGTTSVPNEYRFVDKDLTNGKYYYRLKQIDSDGQFQFSGTVAAIIEIPKDFSLHQNRPNPFNATTTIEYSLPITTQVKLVITDLLGQAVVTLVNTQQAAGSYHVRWDASTVASGIYVYRLEAGDFIQTKKMVLLK